MAVVRREISAHEQFRRRRGYSVTGLGRALGYSHTYVSRVEGGQVKPSPRYRRAVARLLKVPEELIFGEEAVT
jgi:transcriptional regulator with XRE-family HTH domain